jgi:hypothetical protein
MISCLFWRKFITVLWVNYLAITLSIKLGRLSEAHNGAHTVAETAKSFWRDFIKLVAISYRRYVFKRSKNNRNIINLPFCFLKRNVQASETREIMIRLLDTKSCHKISIKVVNEHEKMRIRAEHKANWLTDAAFICFRSHVFVFIRKWFRRRNFAFGQKATPSLCISL